MKNFLLKLFSLLFVINSCDEPNKLIDLKSPSGDIRIILNNNLNSLTYKVFFKNDEVIKSSKLGLLFKNNISMFNEIRIDEIKNHNFDEFYELPWGEFRQIRNHYNENTISFKNSNGIETFDLIFRAYDDGVAFRYYVKNIPETEGEVIISDEITQFNLTEDADVWWTPAYKPNRYEELYKKSQISKMDTAHTPLTIKYDNGTHLSIHEASLVNYSSMQIFQTKSTQLNCDLAPWSNGDKVRITLPFVSPWRTIKIASSATELLNSNLTLNCNEPSKVEETSWIKPSKYIGIWWGMIIGKWTWGEGFRHGATNERSFKYIDFASEHGIDEVLIEGWASGWRGLFSDSSTISFTSSTPDFDLELVQNYAKSKGVSIQAYHETSAGTINYLNQIDSAFRLLNQLEIRNAKIGQVGKKLDNKEFHYGQYGVNYYRTVLEKAIEYKIGVNFHEPIKDTGERRTYPNMLTREGARGMEYNAWQGGNPPNHTTILPFTRLLNSPMDFTPGIFDIYIENTDFDIEAEYPVEITVIDSGNGYQNLTYKGSESLWVEKKMEVDTIFSASRPIYIWKINQSFQVGDWEWGVSADHSGIDEFDIWLLQITKDTKNRKISVDKNGLISGDQTIVIPWQSLNISDKESNNNIPKRKSPPRVSSTLSKQLALYVIIYSPLQMAADFIQNYNSHPAFQFIKDVPVDWDTTVYINGEIGEYVTIARKEKGGRDWFIGGITNENKRFLNIDLSFLDNGLYDATIYSDSKESDWESNPLDYSISKAKLRKGDNYLMKLARGGGQAIKLRFMSD